MKHKQHITDAALHKKLLNARYLRSRHRHIPYTPTGIYSGGGSVSGNCTHQGQNQHARTLYGTSPLTQAQSEPAWDCNPNGYSYKDTRYAK